MLSIWLTPDSQQEGEGRRIRSSRPGQLHAYLKRKRTEGDFVDLSMTCVLHMPALPVVFPH